MTMGDVWVTGYGAVTAAGPTSHDLLNAMLEERSVVEPLADFGSLPAGRVRCIPEHRIARRLERSGRLLVAAAEEAWRRAGLDESSFEPDRAAFIEGSALGPMAALLAACKAETRGVSKAHPRDLLRLMPGEAGSTFAQSHGLHGPVFQISAGSISAACAIGTAYEKIAAGTLDVVVAGGAECPLEPSVIERFVSAGIAEVAPGAGCRPFDLQRRGTVLGEGAGVLILESREHAARRGAFPQAIVSGYATVSEGYSPVAPDPSGSGVFRAARGALNGSGHPTWIKTHGTGTRAGDLAEYRGLLSIFGSGLSLMPVTSLKPLIGHCLGASGGIEAVAAVLALGRGVIPSTLGTTVVDPALEHYDVVLRTRPCSGASVLLLAESFGGRCAALSVQAATS
jgi:3-oxoacyl-[acyl-carrier-protein] synthase II